MRLSHQLGAHLVEHVDGVKECRQGNGRAQRWFHRHLLLLGIQRNEPQEIETDDTISNGDVTQTVNVQIGHDTPRAFEFATARQVSELLW